MDTVTNCFAVLVHLQFRNNKVSRL